jgi:Sulfatase
VPAAPARETTTLVAEAQGFARGADALVAEAFWHASDASVETPAAPARPNILIIMPDELRADALGHAGHPVFRTPSIDRLAGEGVVFANTYCTSPLCMPARASMISGTYPHNHHIQDNSGQLSVESETVAGRLQPAAAVPAGGGVWRAPPALRCPGALRQHVPPGGHPRPHPCRGAGAVAAGLRAGAIRRRARGRRRSVARSGGGAGHRPRAHGQLRRKISLIDARIGRLLAVLDERGWTENTLVIFLSDHGEMGGDHGRYHKSVFFEGAARIPLVLRWPAALPAGRRVAALVEQLDLFPGRQHRLIGPPGAEGIDQQRLINID